MLICFQVYCDQETAGGGWTVIQRRKDGSVDFYRGWQDYKNGFGELTGEFWLGLDNIHQLTRYGKQNYLRVDLENVLFAEYSNFAVDNETNKYKLTVGGYNGKRKFKFVHVIRKVLYLDSVLEAVTTLV